MIGSIIGDIVGSRFEFDNTFKKDFDIFHPSCTFTDDTVLTVCTADVLTNGGSYLEKYQEGYFDYPYRGWGGNFLSMASQGKLQPYGSFGNGSAMRVSPVGWASTSREEVLEEAKKSAEVTHDHPEGIKGAQAVALAIYYARNGMNKKTILKEVAALGYTILPLSFYPTCFDETCQGTIPLCMALFNESKSYEDAIRITIAQGGDCDTTACIVGGIAEAFYGKPDQSLIDYAYKKMPFSMSVKVTAFIRQSCYSDFEAPNVERDAFNTIMSAFKSLWS